MKKKKKKTELFFSFENIDHIPFVGIFEKISWLLKRLACYKNANKKKDKKRP